MPKISKIYAKPFEIIFISIILVVFFALPGFAANEDYAALPPFLTDKVDPNVILVMDYSGSMQAPAYYSGKLYSYYDGEGCLSGNSNVAVYLGDTTRYCDSYTRNISRNYDKTESYYGYFDSNAFYKYDSSNNYWYIDSYTVPDEGDDNVGHVDHGLSGNFLNFLVMSRMDVALKSLIGGKAECSVADNCILRPQGSRRWLEDSNLNIECHVRPRNYSSDDDDYADKDILISIDHQEDESSEIGTFNDRYAKVKIDDEKRQGIVQQNKDKVRFAFLPYANNSEPNVNSEISQGTFLYGTHNQDIDNLVSQLETTVPYGGTATGEAMREAHRYLKQEDLASRNSDYLDKEGAKDPYYIVKNEGTDDEKIEAAWCRKSFLVSISDGEWNGSEDPAKWAHKMHTEDLRSDMKDFQKADVFTLFAFSGDKRGENSMKTVAALGNNNDIDDCPEGGNDGEPYGLDLSEDSRTVVFADSDDCEDDEYCFPYNNCDPAEEDSYDDCCSEWDPDGDGIPDAFFSAERGDEMEAGLREIFSAIRSGTASSTAVTAITSRATSGSVMTQAVFYPEKSFEEGDKISWTGNVFTEWYFNQYVDGNLVQNIREDTNQNNILEINDRILEYEIEDETLEIHAYASDEDGTKADEDPETTYSAIEDVKNLVNFGEKLKDRSSDSRTIYGPSYLEDPANPELEEFTDEKSGLFQDYLGDNSDDYPGCLVENGSPVYGKLINWVRGEENDENDDSANCRSRATGDGNIWKLGDIISSTPTVVNYGNYRMVYTGSNDGMLHAFRLGDLRNYGGDGIVELCEDNSSCNYDDIGKEEWAFIPIDAMPYLRYMADKQYEHIYTVDMKPYIITTEDQTILIGGMRLGGACGNEDEDVVNPPDDIASLGEDEPQVGLSAYFALDITDPLDPEYLWRFTDEDMGFTYSGPAYVRRMNGDEFEHFVVFTSGPTDYDGTSVQDFRYYVVDLVTGNLEHKSEKLNISNPGFGGRLYTDGLDVNKDGQTDFIFMPYASNTNKPNDTYGKMAGGVIALYTGYTDPEEWETKKILDSGGEPITAPVKTMDCFGTPYLYFGSGRYFISDDDSGEDGNFLYGIPFTGDENNEGWSTINRIDKSSDLTCSDVVDGDENAAWKVELRGKEGNYLRERCYSAPTTTNNNIVFFDTTMPSDVICECGGKSRSWALNCASGRGLGASDICGDNDDYEGEFLVDPDRAFKYLVQLSGGDIRQLEKEDFNGGDDDDGSSDDTEGTPGEEGGVNPETILKKTYWKQW